MIMTDSQFSTMMQQQEENELQKLMEKEQWYMKSTPIRKALLILKSFLFLHYFLQYSIPQNLGVASKVKPWKWTVCFSSRIFYSIYKQYLESPKKIHCGHRLALHILVVARA